MSDKDNNTVRSNKTVTTGDGGRLVAASPRPSRARDELITAPTYLNLSRYSKISERRYGCYRLGLLVAVVIIFVLIIGSVPVFVTTDNNKLILIVLIITLIIVGLLIFAYFEWQRRNAIRMRQNSIRGAYTTMERRRSKEQQNYTSVKKKQQDNKKKIQYSLV